MVSVKAEKVQTMALMRASLKAALTFQVPLKAERIAMGPGKE
jgi:hypothetical protein